MKGYCSVDRDKALSCRHPHLQLFTAQRDPNLDRDSEVAYGNTTSDKLNSAEVPYRLSSLPPVCVLGQGNIKVDGWMDGWVGLVMSVCLYHLSAV